MGRRSLLLLPKFWTCRPFHLFLRNLIFFLVDLEVNVHGEGSKTKKTLTSQESHQELIVLGLRLRAGVSHQDFLRHSNGVSLSSSLDLEAVKQLSLEGFVEFDDVGLRTTAKGFLVMDEIVQRILLHTSI